MKRKIYDSFLFFNELDILEIRLNELNDVVDYFILVESSITHQGTPKPFIFEENKERFKKFLNKIIHIKVEDTPNNFIIPPTEFEDTFDGNFLKNTWNHINTTTSFNKLTQPHYGRIFFQRECQKRGMINCKDEDIILSSDVDEIPNPEYLKRLDEFFNPNELYTFNQSKHCYYLNVLFYSHIDNSSNNREINTNWKGTRMGSYKILKNYSFNLLRSQDNNDLINSGWHFSYVGGSNIVEEKIKASDGSGYSNEAFQTQQNLVKVELDDSYPEYIIKNQDKFKHLIK
jgi:beta-1,4-mannosyl-glycoprotein beta-1,4-N-acetylglucosaminyltransferase